MKYYILLAWLFIWPPSETGSGKPVPGTSKGITTPLLRGKIGSAGQLSVL
jgi:hypothetical protein